MSFNDNVQQHLITLRDKRLQLVRERLGLLHDCDCAFCDYDGLDEDNQVRYDELEKDIAEVDRTIKRLMTYANDRKIELPQEVKV